MDDLRRAADGAALALVETPANPNMEVIDIAAAAEAVHAGGGLLVCDNTTATPLLQLPLDLGADVCVQSATKSLSGHSDTLAGVLTLRDEELAESILYVRGEAGTVLGPDPAWLLMRGLRTLAVRVRQHCETALDLAGRLSEHPAVTAVNYPGLPTHPGHELATRQMQGGYGGLMSFVLATAEQAGTLERSLQLIHPATSPRQRGVADRAARPHRTARPHRAGAAADVGRARAPRRPLGRPVAGARRRYAEPVNLRYGFASAAAIALIRGEPMPVAMS
jgi:cystathionine gamma-synthase